MGIIVKLSAIALRQLVDGACKAFGVQATGDAAVEFLSRHFTDHSEKLLRALHTANERAWRALEVALAGESWWERCKLALSSREDTALREQVQAFLDATPLPELVNKTQFRQECLREFKAARKGGVLTGKMAPQELAKEAATFARYENGQALLDAEWATVREMAGALKEAKFSNLAWLIEQRPTQGSSLLAIAVRYFFRREIEQDGELFRGWAYHQLDNLTGTQVAGFDKVNEALKQHGSRLEELLEGIHADVLDIKAEQHRQGQLLRELYDAATALQRRFDLLQKDLSPRHSISYQSEEERRQIKELVARYRRLAAAEREKLPALLNLVGKLEVVAGEFDAAQADFRQVAGMVAEPSAQAEAHYNAYRAALERRKWDEALAELKQAIKLDAARYAPFPLDRYEAERILGAGGFGVAFLCRHRFMDVHVVVKALLSDNLDRDIQVVFNEARTLRQLHAPAIVRVSDDCGYADAGRKVRPYLVMDYFAGTTLEDYVKEKGKLSPEAMLPVAKQIAEGLRAAHGQSILHRDVKPANVLISSSGQEVKLIDFGLAVRLRVVQSTAANQEALHKTLVGSSVAGTLDYAAPEQMGRLGEGVGVGPYSDVYGFGRTCYYALLGTPQPDDDDKESLPASLRRLLSRCTSRTPDKRPATFDAVLQELEPPTGTVRLTVPNEVTVEAGGSQSFPVEVVRLHVDGAVSVHCDTVPPHVEINDIVIPADKSRGAASVRVHRGATSGEATVGLTGTCGATKTEVQLRVRITEPAPPPPPALGEIWPALTAAPLPGNQGRWLVYLETDELPYPGQWWHFSYGNDGVPDPFCLTNALGVQTRQPQYFPRSQEIWGRARGRMPCSAGRGLKVNRDQCLRSFWQPELARLNHTVKIGGLLHRLLGTRLTVRQQLLPALRWYQLELQSETDPYISVLSGGQPPAPRRVELLVEVRKPSLQYAKARNFTAEMSRFANGKVREVWVIDLDAQEVTVHRQPQGSRYAQVSSHHQGDELNPETASDVKVAVDALLDDQQPS